MVLITFFLAGTHAVALDESYIDYKKQAGIVEKTSNGGLCLTIYNKDLKANTKVEIVDPEIPQKHTEAKIVERSDKSCSHDPDVGPDEAFYLLIAANEKVVASPVMLGLVKYTSGFVVSNGLLGFNPQSHQSFDFVRSCTSSEGIHLAVWHGLPLEGHRVWHWYYYLGYDVEGNCTDADFKDPLPDERQ